MFSFHQKYQLYKQYKIFLTVSFNIWWVLWTHVYGRFGWSYMPGTSMTKLPTRLVLKPKFQKMGTPHVSLGDMICGVFYKTRPSPVISPHIARSWHWAAIASAPLPSHKNYRHHMSSIAIAQDPQLLHELSSHHRSLIFIALA